MLVNIILASIMHPFTNSTNIYFLLLHFFAKKLGITIYIRNFACTI